MDLPVSFCLWEPEGLDGWYPLGWAPFIHQVSPHCVGGGNTDLGWTPSGSQPSAGAMPPQRLVFQETLTCGSWGHLVFSICLGVADHRAGTVMCRCEFAVKSVSLTLCDCWVHVCVGGARAVVSASSVPHILEVKTGTGGWLNKHVTSSQSNMNRNLVIHQDLVKNSRFAVKILISISSLNLDTSLPLAELFFSPLK